MSNLDNEYPDPAVPLAEVVMAEDLLVVEANGAEGEPGRDGRTFAGSSAANGRRGRDGGDASPPARGRDAGRIELELRPAGTDERDVELVGFRVTDEGRQHAVRERIAVGDRGVIRLSACGGRGGDGGNGGDGEAGGRGADGSDATRFSSGSDGDPGGDGGDGGRGTSGAAGGRGGQVIVEVDGADTHLLMLTRYQVSGGPGGAAGNHGQGGAGGPGGDGGSSYSWTTTSQEHYTDSQGNRQTRTVTHHHRNRGGSDGAHGNAGRPGQGPLQPGAQGPDGEVRIVVRDGHRTTEYRQRYEVAITGYQLELEDGFAEPTSAVHIRQLTLRNMGGMPTPSRFPVEVRLAPSRWLEPRSHALQLPRPLEAGESFTFTTDKLAADVPDIDYVPRNDPLRESDRACPLAVQTGVNRWFDNLHTREAFPIAFPAELNPVESLESQTTGQAALLVIGMVNRSQAALGRRSPGGRVLRLQVRLENRELARWAMLIDAEGRPVSWDEGYDEEVELLQPGETWSRQLIFGVLPGAPGYQQFELAVALQLGQLHHPDVPRERHCRSYPVRIAQAYDYNPAADLLLVVNHATTAPELEAWKALARRLEQTVAVWDISLNDSLSLSEQLAHGASLLRDFHGRTIVLLNAPFRTALGTRFGDQFLSQMDLIKAAESHGIRVLVVNDQQHDIAHLFRERLVPTDGEPDYRYDSLEALEKARPLDDVDVLFDQVDELIEHGAQAARPDPIRQTSEVDLYGILSASERRLQKAAARLQRRLQSTSPGRRVVVMYKLPAERTSEEQQRDAAEPPRSGWFFNYDYQGTLSVMPTLGDGHPNIIVVSAPADAIHSPEFVQDAAVAVALTQALDFEEKVYLFRAKLRELGEQWRVDPDRIDSRDVALAESLVDALLVDLAAEQAAILKSPWKPLLSGSLIADALPQLKMLADHPFELLTGDAAQADVQVAARLVAGIEFLGRTSSRWYESRIFPWGFFRRGPVVRREVLVLHGRLVQNLFRQPDPAKKELLQGLVQHYFQRRAKLRASVRLDWRTAARQVLLAPLEAHGIVTDLGRPFPAVVSFAQWKAIEEAEQKREASRVQLRAKKEVDRTTFGVARNGQPLPEVAPEIRQVLQAFLAACEQARPARRPAE